MFRMEVDSSPKPVTPSHHDLIIQRLSRLGIPEDQLNQGPRGLVAFAESNRVCISDLVSAILPTDVEEVDDTLFCKSLIWLQWLMFQDEPGAVLQKLAKMSSDQQGVCGAVWGNNDIAYRCRTCEHDPACAICVPCFQNGNHKDHDYSVIYTGGGCCDCGDITAWKREGFCSKHKGAEQIQPLPKHLLESLAPVLDLLLSYWKDNLVSAKRVYEESPGYNAGLKKGSDELTSAVVEMLLDFCKNSESLLSFISQRICSSSGLLDVLLRAERFMDIKAVAKLHELLLKMLGEPKFKYEFAKVFVRYYPTTVNMAINGGGDTAFRKYPLLSTFSVQILTVPTIILRLVKEMDMLGMMLECLEKMLIYCSGDDGRLQVTKWASLYETSLRVIEDVRFVMSHSAVPKYLCHHRQDLVKTWMKILTFVQGMNTQKRETGSLIEDENDNAHLPFVLCHSVSNILALLVGGAFSMVDNNDNSEESFINMYKVECEDQDSHRHAKVGRLSQQSSVGSTMGKNALDPEAKAADSFPVPSCALWVTYECLRSIECWLGLDKTLGPINAVSLKTSDDSGNNFLAFKRTLFRNSPSTDGKSSISSDVLNSQCHSPSQGCLNNGVRLDGQPVGLGATGGSDDNVPDGEINCELESLRLLNLPNWPNITYDVSSQEISIHIPLHHLLAMVLRRALKESYGEPGLSYVESGSTGDPSFARSDDVLGHILGGCHPYGLSGFLMEHPLQIRVFCAQVRAGMWRRNGDAPMLFSEWYRSVRWSEQGQELDIFLLQCCAAMAPPDHYVQRILERFGLSNYMSMNLEQYSEHEPVLVTEMLTLMIQIVKERRFCGLTTAECLQRELVYKLCIGDATRSQLLKSLTRDLSKVDELEEVLERVAEYSQPSGMVQGTYKLRSLYWKELDLYHPRWNSRDQQAAEERYSRFCNASALITQLPKWTKIYPPLRGVAKVATCKTLLHIVRAVLFYAVFTDNLATTRVPDGVLLTTLHLLALTLDICRLHKESGDTLCYVDDVIPTLAFASEEICMGKYGDQSVLSLLVLLMRMHEQENRQNFMESGNFDVASLILSLIKTFVELDQGCMTKLQKIAPQLANKYLQSISSNNAGGMDLASDAQLRKAKARERQADILEKMRAQQSKFLESCTFSEDDEMSDSKTEQDVSGPEISNETQESAKVTCSLCRDSNSKSPVSFIVLLQKSRLLSVTDRGPPSWEQVIRSGEELLSKDIAPSSDLSPISISNGSDMISPLQLEDLVQITVNDCASVGQPQEVNIFMEFIKSQFPSIKNVQFPCMTNDATERTVASLEVLEEHMYWLMRGLPSRLNNSDFQIRNEEFLVDESQCPESLLLGKYIAALPKEQLDNPSASQAGCSGSGKMKLTSSMLHLGCENFGPSGCDGIYISSCGHAVHQECLNLYLVSLRDRYIRRLVFEGGQIVDPDQGQFLCPVCRGLANSVLPALPGNLRKVPLPPPISTINSVDMSCPSTSLDTDGSLRLQDGLSLLQRAANIALNHETIKAVPVSNVRMNPEIEPITRLLCGMYFPGQDKLFGTGRASPSLILWDTLKYSLMSVEIAARSRESSLSPNYGVGALYRELNASSGSILSLLLDIVQSMRTTNSLTALLRYQGIQFFARSLCDGTCPRELSNYYSWLQGDLLCTSQNAEQDVRYPDIELWKRASEPILAHDAFSSFMWLLFCLPWPILSCNESYTSLVHVFYVVAVIQGIIVYLKRQHNDTEMGFDDTVITDIHRLVGGSHGIMQYFESYYIDPTYDINDAIQSLTFPYLRKCALFWKLINCSNEVLFSGEPLYMADDLVSTDTMEELLEVKKLEKMFSIPPLDLVINSEESRLTTSRWMSHFLDVFKAHKVQHILRCNPAVPFKLMLLPDLYQDLLQRYIKTSCPDCGKVKEEPALCLLCGKLCSPNWKICCRESGCQAHSTVCGAGIGVFLLVRRTTILLQRAARQAPWPSPYLDAFGEEDIEMNRGKPLYLNQERYATLTHMVACHGLDRSSKVLRQTTLGFVFTI